MVKPVYVVVFVTMPGWGKNVLCDLLAALDAEGGEYSSEGGKEGGKYSSGPKN